MSAAFKKGDEVYSLHGEAGVYVARVANGHLVEPTYDAPDHDEPCYADPVTWREVFKKPPVQRLHAEIAEQDQRLQALRKQVSDARLEVAEIERGARERAARLAEHRNLQQLDDFFAGKVTHLVYEEDGSIIALADALVRNNEYRNKTIRMLALYGDDGRGYSTVQLAVRPVWKVCEYGDGSGTRKDVILCTSLEQAQQEQLRIIAARWSEHRDAKQHAWSLAGAVKLAREVGAPIPDDILEQHAAMERHSVERGIQSSRKRLADATAEWAAITARAASVGVPVEGGAA